MRNPVSLDPILSSTSSSFSNSSENGLKIKKNSSKFLSRTPTISNSSSGSSVAPILKPRSVSSNESHSNPDEKDSSTSCWFKENPKTDQRFSSNFVESNLRKSFLRKQYQLKKNRFGEELNNFIDTKFKIENKSKSSFVNLINGSNVNNNTYYKTNNLKINQEREERETATTTIILDLEKYYVNDKTSKPNSAKKIMVNIPLTPKKYHTFNENDAPSHKDSASTLVINSQIPINGVQNNKQTNGGDVIFLNKPIAKNNSTVNPNNLKTKPIIRRPPKEFLSANIAQKEPQISVSRNGSVERNSLEDQFYNESNQENRTTSPVTKSLPSYDEALKRVSSDARTSSKNRISSVNKSSPTPFINQQHSINRQNNTNPKSNDPNVASTFIQQNNLTTSGFNTFFKNRNALPNLPLQSTFKSLLSTPLNTNPNGQKIYFRPQDLQNRNNEIYQKPLPEQKTPSPVVLAPPMAPQRRISTKSLYQNTSPTQNRAEIENIPSSNPTPTPVTVPSPVPTKTNDRIMQPTPSPRNEKFENKIDTSQNVKLRSWSNMQETEKQPEKTTWQSTVENKKIDNLVPQLNGLKNDISSQIPSSINNNENKADETITGSFLETISDSSASPTLENKKKDDKFMGLNDARIIKTSSNTTDSASMSNNNKNNNNIFKNNIRNNFKPQLSQAKIIRHNSNSNDPTLERPPGRLNYYDSDTNTISEGVMITSNLIKRSNSEYLHKKVKGDEFSDAPDLSDITEGKFDELDIQGKGHRTSTPNLSKRRRSTSLSSTDLRQIKKQIEELEKMYFEILRIIDPEKNSLYSGNGASSSTSISSFTSSYTESNLKADKSKKTKNEMNHLKHRFTRMESHLTSLAKTVAQISLELKSIKSIEEIIYTLTKEVQELKRLNIKRMNQTSENDLFDKLQDFHRSSSEPNLINSLLNTESLKNSDSNKRLNYSKYAKSTYCLTDKLETDGDRNDKDKFRLQAPSYSNPKKLKKLTKFFGQEPPMLRLFLQKLNYEMYAPNFEHEHITITELPYLSEERLKSLGIPLGPRLRIMKEAQLSFRFDNINYNFV